MERSLWVDVGRCDCGGDCGCGCGCGYGCGWSVRGRGWLWLAVVGCGWLWLVVVVCGWLWLVVVGCGWLWLCVVGWFWPWPWLWLWFVNGLTISNVPTVSMFAARRGTAVRVRPLCLNVKVRSTDTSERDLRVERFGRISWRGGVGWGEGGEEWEGCVAWVGGES